jgi:Tol biopolymer transport system component
VRLSPDGSTIAFVYGGEVGTVGADGTDRQLLTHDPNSNDGDGQDTVSWSPDGSQLAYTSSGNIFVMNADGSGRRRLTSNVPGMGNYYPAWSPDGSTIAFWRGSDSGVDGGPPDADIYTVPANGGAPTRLTRGQGSDYEPAWSPDGSRIVFRHGHVLRVMAADGTHAHDVGSFSNGPWAPVWSPDGTRIALLEYDPSERALDGGPLLRVLMLTLSNGRTADIGVRVETDLNGVQWVSNDVLLINRYD